MAESERKVDADRKAAAAAVAEKRRQSQHHDKELADEATRLQQLSDELQVVSPFTASTPLHNKYANNFETTI